MAIGASSLFFSSFGTLNLKGIATPFPTPGAGADGANEKSAGFLFSFCSFEVDACPKLSTVLFASFSERPLFELPKDDGAGAGADTDAGKRVLELVPVEVDGFSISVALAGEVLKDKPPLPVVPPPTVAGAGASNLNPAPDEVVSAEDEVVRAPKVNPVSVVVDVCAVPNVKPCALEVDDAAEAKEKPDSFDGSDLACDG